MPSLYFNADFPERAIVYVSLVATSVIEESPLVMPHFLALVCGQNANIWWFKLSVSISSNFSEVSDSLTG